MVRIKEDMYGTGLNPNKHDIIVLINWILNAVFD